MAINKEKLLTVSLMLLLIKCLNEEFVIQKRDFLHFTIRARKSQHQPDCTLQLACEDRLLFV